MMKSLSAVISTKSLNITDSSCALERLIILFMFEESSMWWFSVLAVCDDICWADKPTVVLFLHSACEDMEQCRDPPHYAVLHRTSHRVPHSEAFCVSTDPRSQASLSLCPVTPVLQHGVLPGTASGSCRLVRERCAAQSLPGRTSLHPAHHRLHDGQRRRCLHHRAAAGLLRHQNKVSPPFSPYIDSYVYLAISQRRLRIEQRWYIPHIGCYLVLHGKLDGDIAFSLRTRHFSKPNWALF